MTFEKELNETKNPWIKRIGNYLSSRDDIQENLKKENKSLKECFDYVIGEIAEKATRDGNVGYAAGDDEEIYALAVHYYDEDDIKVEKKNFTTNADESADTSKLSQKNGQENKKYESKEVTQETIDKAVNEALKKYKAEEKELEKKKKSEAKAKKEAAKAAKENENQISIFDM